MTRLDGTLRGPRWRWPLGAVLAASFALLQWSCLSSNPSDLSEVETRTSALVAPPVAVTTSWLQYGGDSTHAGSNPFETTIGVNNVSQLALLWTVNLPSGGSGGNTSPSLTHGGHDATSNLPSTPVIDVSNNTAYLVAAGNLFALDAKTGQCKWVAGPNPTNLSCTTVNQQGFNATGMSPSATGRALNATPAIDPSSGFIFVAAEDRRVTNGPVAGYVHRFNSSGTDVTAPFNWPALFNKKIWGAVKPNGAQSGSEPATTSLSLGFSASSATNLYVASGDCDRFGDASDCEGKVTTTNVSSAESKVWNALCSNNATHFGSAYQANQNPCTTHGAAIWAKAGVTFDPATDRVFFGTAEGGSRNPASHHWAVSVVALSANGSPNFFGDPIDNYASYGFADLTGTLSGTGLSHFGHGHMLVLPNNGSVFPRLGVMFGKQAQANNGSLVLLNLDSLGGGTDNHTGREVSLLDTDAVTGFAVSESIEPGATWIDPATGSTWLYFTLRQVQPATNRGLYAFKVVKDGAGKPSIQFQWRDATPTASPQQGGAFVANGVVYYSDGTNIKAFNAVTGVLLKSMSGGARRTPVVVNGILYMPTATTLSAYTVTASAPTNLAAGRPADTSSFLPGVGIPDTVTNANRATDGNLIGVWTSGSLVHTNNEANTVVTGMPGGPYWYVDLGSQKNVREIVIYNRTDGCCAGRLGKFWINYFDEVAGQWKRGSDQSGTLTGSPHHRSNAISASVTPSNVVAVPVSFTSRLVMIQKANLDYLNFAEVQIF